MNFDKITDRMFRKVQGVVFDMTSNTIGVVKDDSVFTAKKGDDGKYELHENLFKDFAMSMPAFAQSKPLNAIKEGDLVLNRSGEIFGWVVKVQPKSLRVMKLTGTISTVSPAKVDLLDQGQTVMVVSSMMQTGTGSSTGINPLMLMAMMDDDDVDMKSMLPMLMMQQQGQGQAQSQMGGIDPMMLMIMMNDKDSGSNKDMLKNMIMMQMIGGAGTNSQLNPMLLMAMMKK